MVLLGTLQKIFGTSVRSDTIWTKSKTKEWKLSFPYKNWGKIGTKQKNFRNILLPDVFGNSKPIFIWRTTYLEFSSATYPHLNIHQLRSTCWPSRRSTNNIQVQGLGWLDWIPLLPYLDLSVNPPGRWMRGAMVTESHESLIRRGQNPPDFVVKLFQMIQNEDPSLIGWDDGMLRVAPLPRCIEGLRKSFCHFVVNLCIYSLRHQLLPLIRF